MPSLLAVTAPLREFFTQRAAERTIRAYVPAQQARVQAHAAAGGKRLVAGRRTVEPVAACLLLRDAVARYLTALEAARDFGADDESLAARELVLPELPADPARPRATPTDDARVREALAARDPLYFDRLPPEDAERARWALERAATMLRRRVEARSLQNVRGTRWGRVAAVLLVLAWIAAAVLRATVLPQNIARGKLVRPSSYKQNPPDGHELVDGDIGTSFGVHTNTEDGPTVTIDLLGSYWLQTIKVYNRVDGWYDDCLPLVVEISGDGKTYAELARRETHFGASPPWTIDAGGRGARFVRLRVDRRSYIALSEVEIYGRKE